VRSETGGPGNFAACALCTSRALRALAAAGAMAWMIAGCGTSTKRAPEIEREPTGAASALVAPPQRAQTPRRGGYYQDDGPGDTPPPNIDAIPEPKPRVEPLHRFANNPYSVFGRKYVPHKVQRPYRERGTGSWYGRKFHGQRTSSGEPYDMYAMTGAHRLLPIPSYARVTNLANGRSVIVRINDRGPFHADRIIDLSYSAAYKLGYAAAGSAALEVESITPGDMPAAALSRRESGAAAAGAMTAGAMIVSGSPSTEPVADTRAVALAPASEARPVAAEPMRAEEHTDTGPAAAAAQSAAPIPLTSESSGVYLQLGAFTARENAESFRVRLYQSLAWLEQAIQILPKDGLFRLHLGPYRNRLEANGIAERIRSALDLRPVLVVR